MELVLVAHNIRSIHNVGSLARTADGLGISKIFCTGYTPYMTADPDTRPPHVRARLMKELHKVALGAESSVQIVHRPDIKDLIASLKLDGFEIVGLEQSEKSIPLLDIEVVKAAIILGEEVAGLPGEIQKLCDKLAEIPMLGKKESFNVAVAGAIAMYELSRRNLYNFKQ